MSEIEDKPKKADLLKDLESIHESLVDEIEHSLQESDIPLLTDTIPESDEEVDSRRPEVSPPNPKNAKHYFDEKLIFDEEDDEDEGKEDVPMAMSEEDMLKEAYRQTLADAEGFLEEATGVLPGQQSLFDTDMVGELEESEESLHSTGVRKAIQDEDLVHVAPVQDVLPQAEGENPFLPQHIRERLHQGKSSFMEEIAQVSESLNRFGHSRNRDKLISPPPKNATVSVIDELVAKYLPLIEADLRAKLAEEFSGKTESVKSPSKKEE